jgi:CheY-like chemotaxis protein
MDQFRPLAYNSQLTSAYTSMPRLVALSMEGSEMSSIKRILLVEDDSLTSAAVRMVLEWEGYNVDCAVNGQEALDHLRLSEEKPNLILLDVGMPILDGYQFRDEQKRDPAINNIPVVVVSGGDIDSSLDASGYVHKPFQPEELLETIRSCSSEIQDGS